MYTHALFLLLGFGLILKGEIFKKGRDEYDSNTRP